MSDEDNQAPRPSSPDQGYKLDRKIRVQLQSRFDVEALESLLQLMSVKERAQFIGTLVPPLGVSSHPATPSRPPNNHGTQQDILILVRDSDPARQALLDKMWAPYWDSLPKGAVDDPSYPYPGRELARIRQGGAVSASTMCPSWSQPPT